MGIRDNYALFLWWGNVGFTGLMSSWMYLMLGFSLWRPLYCTIEREFKIWVAFSLSICIGRMGSVPDCKQPLSPSAPQVLTTPESFCILLITILTGEFFYLNVIPAASQTVIGNLSLKVYRVT